MSIGNWKYAEHKVSLAFPNANNFYIELKLRENLSKYQFKLQSDKKETFLKCFVGNLKLLGDEGCDFVVNC